jgi:hypothetical protein
MRGFANRLRTTASAENVLLGIAGPFFAAANVGGRVVGACPDQNGSHPPGVRFKS